MNRQNIVENYWHDIDSRLEKLVQKGVVELPPIKKFGLSLLANNISTEMGALTFKASCSDHLRFLHDMGVSKYLTPKLLNIAQKVFHYKGKISNQYHIARKVNPGDSKEMYRAHFDSHIFTMVLPIKIPNSIAEGRCGELICFTNARKYPKNEITNFIGKAYFKKYASKEGLEKLSKYQQKKVYNFKNYQPLLFFGKTTLHTNYQVSQDCSSYRLTLLAHFFDDTPKYGIGSLLRSLRNR